MFINLQLKNIKKLYLFIFYSLEFFLQNPSYITGYVKRHKENRHSS